MCNGCRRKEENEENSHTKNNEPADGRPLLARSLDTGFLYIETERDSGGAPLMHSHSPHPENGTLV